MNSNLTAMATGWMERGWIPDPLLRFGVRKLVGRRLEEEEAGGVREQERRRKAFLAQLEASPLAIRTDAANQQHYEVPAGFYQQVLGPRLKYSCAWWDESTRDLGEAEEAMLALTCQRARLADGLDILELGCGWGSLTLWMAERYPGSRILAVSNSKSQRAFIEGEAARRGLRNVEVQTADMNDFDTVRKFDRVVSVEMFEHMRNYRELLRRLARFSKPGAFLFVHVFSHRKFAYPFEVRDASDWMAEHFFTGGLMPSDDLIPHFHGDDWQLREHWQISGVHYQKTSEAWLERMDANREQITALFREVYGEQDAERWIMRWRAFFIACAELFGYRGGKEWGVSHYLFEAANARG